MLNGQVLLAGDYVLLFFAGVVVAYLVGLLFFVLVIQPIYKAIRSHFYYKRLNRLNKRLEAYLEKD